VTKEPIRKVIKNFVGNVESLAEKFELNLDFSGCRAIDFLLSFWFASDDKPENLNGMESLGKYANELHGLLSQVISSFMQNQRAVGLEDISRPLFNQFAHKLHKFLKVSAQVTRLCDLLSALRELYNPTGIYTNLSQRAFFEHATRIHAEIIDIAGIEILQEWYNDILQAQSAVPLSSPASAA
jgi:predicted XRE-type DNA-binding protein